MKDQSQRKRKNSVGYPFCFVEKNYNKTSLEGRFQKKIQKAISGNESTAKTETGNIIKTEIHFGPIISDRTKNEKGTDNQRKR